MLLCLAVTIGFRDTKRMGNASGMAIIYELVNPSMFDILVYFLGPPEMESCCICFIKRSLKHIVYKL